MSSLSLTAVWDQTLFSFWHAFFGAPHQAGAYPAHEQPLFTLPSWQGWHEGVCIKERPLLSPAPALPLLSGPVTGPVLDMTGGEGGTFTQDYVVKPFFRGLLVLRRCCGR